MSQIACFLSKLSQGSIFHAFTLVNQAGGHLDGNLANRRSELFLEKDLRSFWALVDSDNAYGVNCTGFRTRKTFG
jgi:hypothetical protein